MYADKITRSMESAIAETKRREIQMLYNEEHNITPTTIKKRSKRCYRSYCSSGWRNYLWN